MKKALIVVDYQKDFVDGSLGFAKAPFLEEIIYKKVTQYLEQGFPVFFTMDTHKQDYLNSREGKHLPILHCIKNTQGWELFGRLSDFTKTHNSNVLLLEKETFGAYDLAEKIEQKIGIPDELELCGVITNICVISNAVLLHTYFRDTRIVVDANACASFEEHLHNQALEIMASLHITVKNNEITL